MNSLYIPNKSKLIACLLIILVITTIFLYTISIRTPWRTTLSWGGHQWLTATTMLTTRNWFREGVLNLKFMRLIHPDSIEFENYHYRNIYYSYPPGTYIPVYLLSLLKGEEPTEIMIMKYNLINHYLITVLLSLTLLIAFLRVGINIVSSSIFSLTPAIMILLMPSTLYWLQNVYFADQAVILIYAFLLFLEILPYSYRNRLTFRILTSFTIFWGIFTDWLFVFVLLVLFIKRVLSSEISFVKLRHFLQSTAWLFCPAILALSLFFAQLLYFDLFTEFIQKGVYRSGLTDNTENFTSTIFFDYVANQFGVFAIFLLWGSLITLLSLLCVIYFIIKSDNQKKINLISYITFGILVILPSFLQIYTLQQHSYIHNFSVLKFSIPLSTIPFAFLPLIIFYFFRLEFKEMKLCINLSDKHRYHLMNIISIIFLIFASIYTYNNHIRYKSLFPKPNYELKEIGDFIRANTIYSDILFTTTILTGEQDWGAPQQTAYSMKNIYRVNTVKDIYQFLDGKKIDSEYKIKIIENRNNDKLLEIKSISELTNSNKDLKLYSIDKKTFFDFINYNCLKGWNDKRDELFLNCEIFADNRIAKDSDIEINYLESGYHRIKVSKKDLTNILWNYWDKGQKPVGYIELINDYDILLVTGMGKIYNIHTNDLSISILQTNLNKIIERFDYNDFNSTDHCHGCKMSIKDIFIDYDIINQNIPQLYVSYIKRNKSKKDCLTLAISTASYEKYSKKPLNFHEKFDTSECISLVDANFHDSGGRIIKLNDQEILFTVGDYKNIYLAQNKHSPYGKILKINISDFSYKIYTIGHRNPQGLFKDKNGNILSTEHGPRGGDELNIINKGGNYGWPESSYGINNDSTIPSFINLESHGQHNEPLFYWVPSIGISELLVYYGDEFYRWRNNFIVSTLRDQSLHIIRHKSNIIINDEKIDIGCRIRDIKTDNFGKIYLLCEDPSILKLEVDINDYIYK